MKNVQYLINVLKLDLDLNHTRQDFKIQEYLKLAAMRTPIVTGPYSIEAIEVYPNEANIIPFPADQEDFISLSMRMYGKWITLSVNRELSVSKPFDICSFIDISEVAAAGFESLNDSNFPECLSIVPHYRNGNFVGEQYSLGTGFNPAGYVTIDEKLRQLKVNGVPRTRLLLQYYADKDFGPMTPIKDASVDFLRYAVRKQWEESRGGNLKAAQYFSIEQLKAFNDMTFQMHVPPLDELMDYLRAGKGTLIKK